MAWSDGSGMAAGVRGVLCSLAACRSVAGLLDR
jgi:hypothetical protein